LIEIGEQLNKPRGPLVGPRESLATKGKLSHIVRIPGIPSLPTEKTLRRESELLLVVSAQTSSTCLSSSLDSRQQQRYHNGNNRDGDQQLDDRETFSHKASPPCTRMRSDAVTSTASEREMHFSILQTTWRSPPVSLPV
jgi:hypothetical protein